MGKNVIIVVLAAACVFLAAGLYGEHSSLEKDEISPAEYGGLLALREAYSSSVYREQVLPLLRQAFVDGRVTRERLHELGAQLKSLGPLTLDVLEQRTTGERVAKTWDDARDGAAALGESLGRQMGEAMRELGDAVEGLKPKRSPDSASEGGVSL